MATATRHLIASALMGLVLNGCYAGIKAYPVSAEKSGDGIRYFLPAPYLVVERTTAGDKFLWDARFETLPDTSRVFTVQPYTFFAKQEATVELNPDGTLKSVVLTQDSTPISAAVVEAVKQVWTKKLELEKAAAEAERTAAVSRKDEAVEKLIWVLRIKGTTLEAMQPKGIDLRFPRLKPSGAEPSGKLEGTFSIPVGAGKIEGVDKNKADQR